MLVRLEITGGGKKQVKGGEDGGFARHFHLLFPLLLLWPDVTQKRSEGKAYGGLKTR